MAQPNVLILLPDDLGKEQLQPFGPGLAPDQQPSTPVLGRLAQQGVIFQRGYTQPWCSPTRAEMVTGAYGFRTGIGSLAEYTQQPLLDGEVCLPRALKLATSNAYVCAEVGKHHLSDWGTVGGEAQHPIKMGYDYFAGSLRNFDGGENYYSWKETIAQMGAGGGIRVQQRMVTEYAPLRQLEAALSWIGRQTKPWFLNYTLNLPHAPYQRPPADLYDSARWVLPDLTAPGVDATARPYFKSMVEAHDAIIGKLLTGIGSTALANTIIIYFADNGTGNEVLDQAYIDAGAGGHAKRTCFELGINTPLIVLGPGVSGGGRTSNAIVKCADLMATIIDLVGGNIGLVPANPAHARDSTSYINVLRGLTDTARTYAWADLFGPNQPHTLCSVQGTRSIGYARYKVIRSATTGVTGFPASVAGTPNSTDALYDLTTDPLELLNLIGTSSPFYNGGTGKVTLVDADATHPGVKTAYDTAIAEYASLTTSL